MYNIFRKFLIVVYRYPRSFKKFRNFLKNLKLFQFFIRLHFLKKFIIAGIILDIFRNNFRPI